MSDVLRTTLQDQGLDSEPIPGQQSKNGKYRTYVVRAQLNDRDSLDSLARALSGCPGVKFLL
jgi:putative lipoic acid-binding regulatory protein